MRVAINSAIDLRGISGTARSVEMIRQALARLSDVETVDVFPPHPPDRTKVRNALDQVIWDFWAASRADPDADVLISPCNMGARRPGRGHVLVVHDTMAFDIREQFDPAYGAFFRALTGISVRASDVVIVPSQYTARRMRDRWPSANVLIAPWPVRAPTLRRSREKAFSSRNVLMVGTTEPFKNHLVGFEAVAACRKLTGEHVTLTLVGPAGRGEADLRARAALLDPHGQWIDRRISVTDHELDDLYANAWVLLQPSLLEGFGFPVAEAAVIGLPVVHSGRGSLPEIVDTGVTEPDNPDSYARRLQALLDSREYASQASRAAEIKSRFSDAAFDANLTEALAIARHS